MANKRGQHEGTISQLPSGKWRAQICIQGQRLSSSFRTKEECRAWVRRMKGESDQGYDHSGGQTLLKDYLPEWLDTKRLSLRPKTFHQYQRLVTNHILPSFGTSRLSYLRTDQLERFYSRLIQQGIGSRTVRMAHCILHQSLEKAVRYGLLLRNPTTGATQPKYRSPEMMVLDAEQVNRFLTAAKGNPFEVLFHLAIVTGMRQGELFGLKWMDLQWHTGALHVRRQVQHVPREGWVFTDPKTRAGKRVVLIGDGMLNALRDHQQRQMDQIMDAGSKWQNLDLIFPSTVGTPQHPSNMRPHFNEVLDRARLPRIRFHDLRHTAASLMLNHNVPAIVASRRMGHSKPSITLDIYGHLFHEMQGDAARIMDELVNPIQVVLPTQVTQDADRGRG